MEIVFDRVGEIVVIKIEGRNVYFSNMDVGLQYCYPIDTLKLNINGILKEYPDLIGLQENEIRKIAIQRFKDKIRDFATDKEVENFIIKEFQDMGYKLKYINKEGFRNARH